MNLQKIVKSQKYRHNGKIGIRSIEVFFKVCKSYLNLGKEFQGLSYDSNDCAYCNCNDEIHDVSC